MGAIKTPITYWGGKQNLLPEILPIIPEHLTYCEPFFGGGAVFWAKQPSKIEIINDLNKNVVNFYRQVECNFDALQERIRSTPHSRALYLDALVMYSNPHLFSELDLAWAFYTLCNQGYSGKIGTWGFGTTTNCSEKRLHNRREDFTSHLKARLERVQMECHDALYLIKLRDRDTTFFYIDPPYFNSDMGHYGGYTKDDFEKLLQLCSQIKGKFLLSSYPSDLLDEYAKKHGWVQKEFKMAATASSLRKPKTEVLTANYDITQPTQTRVGGGI